MKKSLILLAVALVSAFALVFSCNSASGPEKVAKTALEALKSGDYDAYAATFDVSSADQKFIAGMIEEKGKESFEEHGGIVSYKIYDTEIDGEKASCTARLTFKDGSEQEEKMHFVQKEDGKWLQELVK